MAAKGSGVGLIITIDTKSVEQTLMKFERALDPKSLLKPVGEALKFWINENFRRGGIEQRWAPLADSTLANPRRGGAGAQVLRNKGKLAQSFDAYGVKFKGKDAISVGTEVPYAKYHHFGGTRSYIIRPRVAKVLAFWTVGGLTFRKEVKHPPLPKRPLLPSERLARKIARDTLQAYLDKKVKEYGGP